MIKILFVCHGNICRSPMAEYITKKIVKDRGIDKDFHIESRATSTEEIYRGIGNPIYPPAKRELSKHGIEVTDHHAKQVTQQDYDKYDYLICMDYNNMRNIKRMLNDKESKISMLLENREVSDPWYTGDFETCYKDILEGCQKLVKKLETRI